MSPRAELSGCPYVIDAHGHPVPTNEQARLGAQLSTRLGMTVGSYIEWFTEGVPGEWVTALEHIQTVLTEVKRAAAHAARAERQAVGAASGRSTLAFV